MCGIAGILSAEPLGVRHREALGAMRAALRHRGPDGEGEWFSPCGRAAFSHTRLAIFDPTPAARQPMTTADGRLTICYNGAVYNHARLRQSLEQRGAAFRTASDTEVVLQLFATHGSVAVKELLGMFAFAVWDEQARTCVLARDPFGIKPLYYAQDGDTLVFASELRALQQSGLVADALDPDGVYGYLRTGSVPEPHTLLRDVRCLPAGHQLTWSPDRVSMSQYWSLRFAADQGAELAVRDALLDSVDRHCAADVPVGVFLSGGIDSSAILALAHTAGHRGLTALSLSFPDESDHDEAPVARRTAAHFGARFEAVEVTAASARLAYHDYTRALDQPSIDGLNTFIMARAARAAGVPVVLSGVGADELFGGYPAFAGVPRLATWHKALEWTGTASAIGRLAASASSGVRTRRVADMLSRRAGLENAYQTFRGIFTEPEATALVREWLGVSGPFTLPSAPPDTDRPGDAVTRLELSRYVRNQLLRDGDVMAMASGVELRTPFLDAVVVDQLSSVAASVRLEAGKALLRRAVPELPPWAGSQPKRCFQFPFERWLDGEWREHFSGEDHAGQVPFDTWYRRWCVSTLRLWMSNSRMAVHA